ncbi:30S small subunit ribosomal protein S17 [Kwoniella heveanensis CBS 569]|uniref:30S small subunit ribosomal protein S17 n=1 Tax=Kwoniella heveanensis BCC8398 TaxID=1296120 RepID=A0A1B9GQI5_9TREE|nr:30S small subunit ribosomal protein S17 [Kwoniella heveanensis BCC8398]OCF41411.1 30S small subunit ribosomal protein S17 [Kwoniella heveanensis CBS 569]
MPYQPNHIFKGVVTKVGAMRKTATVTVERVFEHPKILKEIKRHKKYLVHDENEVARLDDKVTIIHGARTSRRKAFRLLSIDARDTTRHGGDSASQSLPGPSEIGAPKLKPRKEKERAQAGVLESLKELRGDGAAVAR